MSSRARTVSGPPWARPATGGDELVPRADGRSDLVIVGAGYAGLTAAVHAAAAGARVTVVRGAPPASAALPGWSSPLQAETPHDIRLLHGEPALRAWAAQLARSAEFLARTSGDLDVKLEERDFAVSTVEGHWAFQLRFVARALRIAGHECFFEDRSGLPFPVRPELIVADGGVVDPTRWIDALADRARDLGVRILPGMLAGLRVERGLATVDAGLSTQVAPRVIVASSAPLVDRALLRARARTEQWHLLALRTESFPHRELQLLDRPVTVMSRYGEHLVIGQRTGSATDLLEWVGRRLPDAQVTHWWSTTSTRSIDALPLVGSASLHNDTVLTASGLGDFALGVGTAAGLQLADVALGRTNAADLPWKPTRAVTPNGASKRLRSAMIGPIPFITRLNVPARRDQPRIVAGTAPR